MIEKRTTYALYGTLVRDGNPPVSFKSEGSISPCVRTSRDIEIFQDRLSVSINAQCKITTWFPIKTTYRPSFFKWFSKKKKEEKK